VKNAGPALVLAGMLLASCGRGDGGPSSTTEIPLQRVIDDPERYEGREIRVRARYYASFEVSVLAAQLTESSPPQPAGPLVWVGASPAGPCLRRSSDAAWAEQAVATGTFHHDPEGAFGHLGGYWMELADARVRCP
jgi:hypothetical protein